MLPTILLSAVVALSSIPSVFALPGDALFARQNCGANNCLRAVRGNANGAADCSSFLLRRVNSCGPATTATTTTTVTSTAVTITSSSTTILTLTSTTPALRRRQAMCSAMTVTPSSVPTYASNCGGTVRYSSACSCIGVSTSSTTLTVPSMITTSTVSVTVTASTTIVTTVTSTTVTSVSRSSSSSSSTTSSTSSTSSNTSSTSSTSSSSSSSTTSSTTSSTSSTSTPTTPAFRLVVPGGRRLRTSTSDRSLMPVNGGGTNGDLYTIINGEVHNYGNTASRWSLMTATSNDIIYDTTDGSTFTIRCTVANPSSQTGQLNCVGRDSSQIYFELCNEKVTLSKTYSVQGCAAIDLQAVSINN